MAAPVAELDWARVSLPSGGLVTETVCETPYSHVVRLRAGEHVVYLKKTPASLFREASVMKLLATCQPGGVPEIVASDARLYCFLMRNAGQPLRACLKAGADVDLFMQALQHYVQLQQTSALHVQDLLAIGVPDWRCSLLPEVFSRLLQNPALTTGSFSMSELDRLQRYTDAVHRHCEALSAFAIPATLEHADFHDNNILIGQAGSCVIDWGEAVISHPFFSLINCLYSAAHHHGYVEGHPVHAKLKDAYLQTWKNLAEISEIEAAFEQAKQLAGVYKVLVYAQLAAACGDDGAVYWQQRIIPGLRQLILGAVK